ncbi:MAG: GGDEF domain-containing protein [Pseudomonadota bacterium]
MGNRKLTSPPISKPSAAPGVVRAYRRAQAGKSAAGVEPVSPVRPAAVITDIGGDLPPRLALAFQQLHDQVGALNRDLDAARARIRELEAQVETDDLLPVANRRGFDRDVERALAEVERHSLSAAIMFLDVDRMKTINDSYGHAAGDAALMHVADVLRTQLRTTDSVARVGGDEFAVLLTHVVAEEARAKARQLAAAITATPVLYAGGEFTMTVSTGIEMLEPGADATQLMSSADRAMYADKRRARVG